MHVGRAENATLRVLVDSFLTGRTTRILMTNAAPSRPAKRMVFARDPRKRNWQAASVRGDCKPERGWTEKAERLTNVREMECCRSINQE